MKFGVQLFGTNPLARPSQDNFHDIVALATAAERLGFDMVYAGQHYLVKHFQKFQPIPVLSRISAYTGAMRVNVTDLLPLNHPVRLAEELASMDAMTDGRVVLTAALGYAEHEFAAFGLSKRERAGPVPGGGRGDQAALDHPEANFEGRLFKLEARASTPSQSRSRGPRSG
jgi:alkanesulfonate monooxygenase SsuD/methylene tetrahydromethanopterin reductase-like flavin-dependent oxidoreductase (luciferase family)